MWQQGSDLSLVWNLSPQRVRTWRSPGVRRGWPSDKCLKVCVSRPSGLKPLLNARPRNDTDMVPSRAPPSPDCVPGKHNLHHFAPPPPLRSSPLILQLHLGGLSPRVARCCIHHHASWAIVIVFNEILAKWKKWSQFCDSSSDN